MQTVPQPSPQRLPQFELLRVLCMFGIVVNHFFTYGLDIYGHQGEAFSIPIDSAPQAILWTVLESQKLLALCSVNCFVLITGYFMATHTGFRFKGIRRVWLQTVFWGVAVYLLMAILGMDAFHPLQALKFLFPLTTNAYWFITSYVGLMFLAPFLSRLVTSMDRRTHGLLLLAGFGICFQYPFGHMFTDPQQLVLFVYLFLCGAYIRRYTTFPRFTTGRCTLLAALLFGAMFMQTLFKNLIYAEYPFLIYAMGYNSLVLPFSILVFLLFTQVRCAAPLSRVLTTVSPLVLAVYLIHSHPIFQDWMWQSIGRSALSQSPMAMPALCLGWSLLIFIACIVAEWVRQSVVHYLMQAFRRIRGLNGES